MVERVRECEGMRERARKNGKGGEERRTRRNREEREGVGSGERWNGEREIGRASCRERV